MTEKISEKLINLDLDAKNWEEAIIKGSEILIKEGYIEKKYVEVLLKVTKSEGPYYIITKGVALPHVSPDEGIKKSGFSFIKLRTPLNFGNKENDPVKYIMFLMALNSEEHINLIQLIVKIIEDRNFFELVEKFKQNSKENIKNIYEYLINRITEGDDLK